MIGSVELRDRWSHKSFFDFRTRVANLNISTMIVVLVAAAASLSPAMLPRPAWVQGMFTGVLVLFGLAAGRGAAQLAQWLRPTPDARVIGNPRAAPLDRVPGMRAGTAGAAAFLLIATLVAAHRWQNGLREAIGAPMIGIDYWQTVIVVATASVLGVVGATRWMRRPRSRTRSLVTLAAAVVTLVVAGTVLVPTSPASADNTVVPGPTRSGSVDSVVRLDDLRGHGRTFVTGGPAEQIRVYVSPDTAADPSRRAALALEELDRTRAWDRPLILVAVPTGSGWVDTRALEGFTDRFGADTAVVAAAYSRLPSWLASVVSRRDAITTTTELLAGIERRVEALPVDRRPAVLLYGQSLGAVAGAEAARLLANDANAAPLCAQFLVGPPMGTPIAARANVLANSSDPVVVWSPKLLVSPPVSTARRDDAPQPGWLPILGFLQTSVDLLSALAPGPGHGHQYGTDQVDGPLYCTPDPVTAPTVSAAPLATSNAAATR